MGLLDPVKKAIAPVTAGLTSAVGTTQNGQGGSVGPALPDPNSTAGKIADAATNAAGNVKTAVTGATGLTATPAPTEPQAPAADNPLNNGSAEDTAAQSDAAKQAATYAAPAPEVQTPAQVDPLNNGSAEDAAAASPAAKAAATYVAPASDVGVQGTKPASTATPFDEIIDAFKNYATATDDPVASKIYNQTVARITQADAAKQAVLNAQIKADPSLRGQPVGSAILAIAARQAGATLSQAVAGLSVDSVQRIQDLNKYGWEGVQAATAQRIAYQANRRQELLNSGSFDAYADQMEADGFPRPNVDELKEMSAFASQQAEAITTAINSAISDGREEDAAAAFERLKKLMPLTYGEMTLDDYMSKAQRYVQHNDATNTINETVRNAFLQHTDEATATGIAGLQQLYDEETASTGGQALLDAGLTLDEANRLLTQAGMETVATLDGFDPTRLDDLYIAKKWDDTGKQASGANAADNFIRTYGDMMHVDVTTPEGQQALRALFFSNGVLTLDANGGVVVDQTKMQDPFATSDANNNISHLFVRWPVAMPDGSSVGGWTSYYDSRDTDHTNDYPPATGSQASTLNTAWENYIHANPTHLSREDWYNSVIKNPDNWNGSTLKTDLALSEGTGTGGQGGDTKLPNKIDAAALTTLDKVYDPGMEADPVTQKAFASSFTKLAADAENLKAWLSNPDNVAKAALFGVLGDYKDVSKIKYSNEDYAAKAEKNNGWIAAPDGQAYHMEKPPAGSDYGASLKGVGNGFMMTGVDGKKYFMVTKSVAGGPAVGTVLPLTETKNSSDLLKTTNGAKGTVYDVNTGALAHGNSADIEAVRNSNVDGTYYYYAGGA